QSGSAQSNRPSLSSSRPFAQRPASLMRRQAGPQVTPSGGSQVSGNVTTPSPQTAMPQSGLAAQSGAAQSPSVAPAAAAPLVQISAGVQVACVVSQWFDAHCPSAVQYATHTAPVIVAEKS